MRNQAERSAQDTRTDYKVSKAVYRGETTRYNRGAVRNYKNYMHRAQRRLDKVLASETQE